MRKLYILLFIFLYANAYAQSHYAVELIDKEADRVTHFVNNPSEMLTQRAIDRRQKLGIPYNATDVPIDENLIQQCKNTGATILSHSKWLNTIFVDATTDQITEIKNLSFVKKTKPLEKMNSGKKIPDAEFAETFSKRMTQYGQSDVFIKQIKVDFLHNKNYDGNGIQIAVLDAGFPGVNTIDTFKELRDRNGILGTYNFVTDNENVYKDNGHGTMVLSTMAVNKPNTYIGTAPKADYWLFTTEDNAAETPREEFFWIEAIEFADSVGVDVLNSSLGYQDFDNDFISYTYNDMDGETSFISRAASIGGQKGILVVISAGNEGDMSDETKHFIWSPADAKNIITVGAVNSSNTVAGFSSYGPTADGRIKPDVCSMGEGVPLYDKNGNLSHSNGTSFSSPITAGSVACLRQAFPTARVSAIIEALHKSADNYNTPDDRTGYGIANFEGAYNILQAQLSIDDFDFHKLLISPNPVSDIIYVNGIDSKKYNFKIYDTLGRIVKKGQGNFVDGVNISELERGYYQLSISDKKTLSFLKKN